MTDYVVRVVGSKRETPWYCRHFHDVTSPGALGGPMYWVGIFTAPLTG